jgi:hypothetical protein
VLSLARSLSLPPSLPPFLPPSLSLSLKFRERCTLETCVDVMPVFPSMEGWSMWPLIASTDAFFSFVGGNDSRRNTNRAPRWD